MIQFPEWAEKPNLTPKRRASLRLKYLLGRISLENVGEFSMRALGEQAGLDHSTLSHAVKKGAFSQYAAERIAATVGKGHVTAAALVDPLSIRTSKGA